MRVVEAAARLRDEVDALRFGGRVHTVYNPLRYAWGMHERFLRTYLEGRRPLALALGMNPGPWGMGQTGVPFGDPVKVRDWMGLEGPVEKPANERPDRPVLGFASRRREASGSRLYGLAEEKYGTPGAFFDRWALVNYCPLLFYAESGTNLTPPQLRKADREALFEACDRHLRAVVDALRPRYVVGIGAFAEERALAAGVPVEGVLRVAHPSPANPRANRGWSTAVHEDLAAVPELCARTPGRPLP